QALQPRKLHSHVQFQLVRLAQLEAANSNIRIKTGSQGSMKSQMKKADQAGAVYAIILGEREWEAQQLAVKELATAEQSQVALAELVPFLIEKFTK
ncbi:His/Gly/Thr/Pro-type tRNA ligase C-terminal domain-containing protein, partial [Acinetobacter baumannii]